jgi:hypothetical protein
MSDFSRSDTLKRIREDANLNMITVEALKGKVQAVGTVDGRTRFKYSYYSTPHIPKHDLDEQLDELSVDEYRQVVLRAAQDAVRQLNNLVRGNLREAANTDRDETDRLQRAEYAHYAMERKDNIERWYLNSVATR